MSVSSPPEIEFLDKRRERSRQSRQLILDSVISLWNEGELELTAKTISARAGVGIRTFFRHFGDLDSLWMAVDSEIRDSYRQEFAGGDRSGPLDDRVNNLLRYHARAYEKVRPLVLATEILLWQSPALRENYAKAQLDLRKNLEDWLPELKQFSPENREAIDAVASFDYWHRLRAHQKLSEKTAIKLVASLLQSLMQEGMVRE